MLACTESNGSITPLLVNTLDRGSRSAPGEKPLECFEVEFAGLAAALRGTLASRSTRADGFAASHRVARAARSPRRRRSSTGRSAAVHTA